MFNNTNKIYWGEFTKKREPENEWDKIVPKELGKLVIVSAIKPELPKLYQPIPDESCNKSFVVPKECSTMDSTILDTIKLIHHSRKVQELINIATSEDEENVAERIKNCPPFPEISEKDSKKSNINRYYKVLQENEISQFACGKPVEQIKLSSSSVKKILKKSVSCLLAHTGFDCAFSSALNVLTDVADDFFRKFTLHLRHVVDEDILQGPSMFPDPMEQVFYKMGLGSMRNLQGFYQTNVLDYKERVRDDALKVVGEYQVCCALLQVKDPPYDIRYKKEEGDDSDIPEIHFPASGDGDGVDELQPSLEPEFQMLEMLEQEVHSIP